MLRQWLFSAGGVAFPCSEAPCAVGGMAKLEFVVVDAAELFADVAIAF